MNSLDRYSPQFLSILRIVAGMLLLEHGTAKLLDFPHNTMFTQLSPLLIAAGLIELIGGALVVLGLFSRIAAFIASGETAVAYWMVHVPKGGFFPVLNGADAAILFCFVFLYLVAAGPGSWAINRS